jgi:O-antigen/teichoic acid export membrane protein
LIPGVDPPAPPAGPPPDDPAAGQRVVGLLRSPRFAPLKSDFGNKVVQTFAAEVVLGALGLLTGIVTARWLGPSGKGEFALVTVVMGLVVAFGQVGLSPAVVYFTKRVPPRELTANALTLSAMLSLVTFVVGGAAIYFGVSRALSLSESLLAVALLGLPPLFLRNAAASLIQGRYDLARFNLLRILDPLLFLPLVVAAFFFPDRVQAAVVAWTAAQALSAAVAVVVAVKGTGVTRRDWAPRWQRWKDLLGFGARTHVGNMLKFFQYRFDVVIIGALLDKRQVGLYVVGLSLAEVPLRIPDAVGLVLFPKVAALRADHRKEEMTPLVVRHTLFLTLVSSALLFALTPVLLTALFGRQFEDARVATWLLLPGGVALSLWKILAQDLIARGRPNTYSVSALCSLVTMVVGCIVLVPWLGLAGGGIASSLAYLTAAGAIWVAYRRSTGQRLGACTRMGREDLALYRDGFRRIKSALRRS